jgi:hypothetical protein
VGENLAIRRFLPYLGGFFNPSEKPTAGPLRKAGGIISPFVHDH